MENNFTQTPHHFARVLRGLDELTEHFKHEPDKLNRWIKQLLLLCECSDREDIDDLMSRGQIRSKLWVIQTLKLLGLNAGNSLICGGWYGTLGRLLVESESCKVVHSFDIDYKAIKLANVFNNDLSSDNKFIWGDCAEKMSYVNNYDTVINTSCEHFENFEGFLHQVPSGKLLILQSNNFYNANGHVNCHANLDDFRESVQLDEELFSGTLKLYGYDRYMIIGRK